MRVAAERVERGPIVSVTIVVASLVLLALSLATGRSALPVMAVVAATVVAVAHRKLFTWTTLLGCLFLVILFVPIKRYELPGNLPFDLELYRLLVAGILGGWFLSLLADRRVELVRSGFEGPVLAIAVTSVASVAVNHGRVASLDIEHEAIKGLTFLFSYFLVFYLMVSVLRRFEDIDLLVRVLVVGGAIVAIEAMVEYRTGIYVFDRLASAFPLMSPTDQIGSDVRLGQARVRASAQGPIALGAMLTVLLPLSVYVALRNGRTRWWIAAGVIAIGALATISRTTVVMLFAGLVVFIVLRPALVMRMGMLLVPLLVVAYVAVPGAVGSVRGAFFPAGGLIAEQQRHPGWAGSGRLSDISPSLEQFAKQPLLGQGYATRQTGTDDARDLILDNQWLKSLLETGALGILAWIWLFSRFARRAGREARADDSDRGWLLTACVASLSAFALGMFLFDAFAFIQVTFVVFLVLALGAAAMRSGPPATEAVSTEE